MLCDGAFFTTTFKFYNMTNTIIQFVLNTLGIVIIWAIILQNKKFDLYSKEGFYTFLAIVLAATLIKIKL